MVRASTIAKYIGRRYGRYTILSYVYSPGKCQYFYRCRCDCGVEKDVRLSCLQQGTTQSCGCLSQERNKAAHKGNTYRRLSNGEAALNSIYHRYRGEARKRGIPFSLTPEKARELITSHCFYCDSPPSATAGLATNNGRALYNGIDRVDNDLGYHESNCVPCCKSCNSAKNMVPRWIIEKAFRFLSTQALETDEPPLSVA